MAVSYEDLIIHLGGTIADVLEECHISEDELAKRTRLSLDYIRDVKEGEEDITETFAVAFEQAFDVLASFWINLQKNYDKELLHFIKKAMWKSRNMKSCVSMVSFFIPR